MPPDSRHELLTTFDSPKSAQITILLFPDLTYVLSRDMLYQLGCGPSGGVRKADRTVLVTSTGNVPGNRRQSVSVTEAATTQPAVRGVLNGAIARSRELRRQVRRDFQYRLKTFIFMLIELLFVLSDFSFNVTRLQNLLFFIVRTALRHSVSFVRDKCPGLCSPLFDPALLTSLLTLLTVEIFA